MYTILENSSAIHGMIRNLFSAKTRSRRRVIIVGFVGIDAPSLLPDVKDVELYCWPQAGSTNPYAINNLLKLGARVFFVDNLHTKLYWVEGKGAVVTSANLSKNAMGVGGLHEFGVYLQNPSGININQIIQSLDCRLARKAEIQELHRQHDLNLRKNRAARQPSKANIRAPGFVDWYQDRPKNWKLGWWEEEVKWITAEPILSRAKKEFDLEKDVKDGLYCRKDQYREGDWLLFFRLPPNNEKPKWMFVDIVGRIPQNDPAYDESYPYQAVQVRKKSRTAAPFSIDREFTEAFGMALQEYRVNKIKRLRNLTPNKEFLKVLLKSIRSVRRRTKLTEK